ncbi:MAG: DUF2088 domain-containing protein [Chloroflexi bacterium]|nr:DUF2088 domain-containing protein [Chloroflexota bacterium]
MQMDQLLDRVTFPRIARARQKFPARKPVDVEAEIERELSRPEIASKVKPGQSVAVASGSRGIASIQKITRAVVTQLKEMGAEPFIVPAMGSHGGATAEGQVKVLAHLGITEETVGAPIRSSMDVVRLGTSPSGVPVYFDKLANSADATVLINRVKRHTGFRGPVESGLLKMMTIGLGKERGANTVHDLGYERFGDLIPEMGRCIVQHGNVIFGVATVENAQEEVAKIVAVEAHRIEEVERGLLIEATEMMPRILFPQLDVLVVQEIGKNISGTGMDPNVTGRFIGYLGTSGSRAQRVVVLDLSEQTYGNSLGIGMADITTQRLVDKTDYQVVYVNAMTSRSMDNAKMPMTLATDKQAIAAAIASCFGVEPGQHKVMFIQNTLKLEDVYISSALLEEAQAREDVDVLGELLDIPFDVSGTLCLPFE